MGVYEVEGVRTFLNTGLFFSASLFPAPSLHPLLTVVLQPLPGILYQVQRRISVTDCVCLCVCVERTVNVLSCESVCVRMSIQLCVRVPE